MRRKKNAPDEYEVGYGKPPQHTRFKPGQSGNPKGRPKGSQNLRSVLHDALFKKVPVTEDGRLCTMSRVQAIVTGLVARALKGDNRAAESVLKLANQHFPPGVEERETEILVLRDPFPDDDEDPWGILRRRKRGVGRVKAHSGGSDDEESG
jgi:uncharacterized protein DUF5681